MRTLEDFWKLLALSAHRRAAARHCCEVAARSALGDAPWRGMVQGDVGSGKTAVAFAAIATGLRTAAFRRR